MVHKRSPFGPYKMDKVERRSREIIGNYWRLNDDYKEGLIRCQRRQSRLSDQIKGFVYYILIKIKRIFDKSNHHKQDII